MNTYKAHRKFSNTNFHKKLLHVIEPAIALERFHIVMHSYAVSVSIKPCFYETKNSFYLKN